MEMGIWVQTGGGQFRSWVGWRNVKAGSGQAVPTHKGNSAQHPPTSKMQGSESGPQTQQLPKRDPKPLSKRRRTKKTTSPRSQWPMSGCRLKWVPHMPKGKEARGDLSLEDSRVLSPHSRHIIGQDATLSSTKPSLPKVPASGPDPGPLSYQGHILK